MKVAKPDKHDIDVVGEFLNASELALESVKWGINSPEDKWEDLDEDDPDRLLIMQIKKELEEEEGRKMDNRIVMFTYLQRKYMKANTSWRRVYWAADLLIDNVCDPSEDHLAFHPGFDFLHVTPEQ